MGMKRILAALLLLTLAAPAYGEFEDIDQAILRAVAKAWKAKNYKKVFSLISPVAEDGNAEFQYFRCKFHWHGLGTNEDSQAAMNWCKKAASKKYKADEMFKLISKIALSTKAGRPLQKTPALKALKAKAESGDKNAQWLMYRAAKGNLFWFEEGADKDQKKKQREAERKWLKVAVESNHPKALYEHARHWIRSDDPDDQKKFVDYMTSSADQGNTDAMERLGSYYRPDEYGDEPEKPHKNYAKATKWYRTAAEADDVDVHLYQLLRNRKNPERDYDEGLKWMIVAADQGIMEAEVALAEVYELGKEVPINLETARNLYQKASIHNYAETYF